jgi:hypothetical protein
VVEEPQELPALLRVLLGQQGKMVTLDAVVTVEVVVDLL